ncbi:MAG: response regulator, partial [Synergistaceae bacterium]
MRRKTMLIVDDIDLNRTILNSCFSAEFNIVEAENGKEALTLLSKTQIDIIITDIMMPEMDGISLISALRKNSNFTNLPVIAITSRGEEYELKALKAGADDFVNKPFTPELLRHRVTSVLSQNKFQKHFLSHNFAYNSMKIPFAILRKNSDSTSFEYQYVNNSFAMIFKTTPDELVLEHKKIIDKNLLGFFTTMGTPVYTEHDTIYLEGPQKYYDIIAYIEENEFYCFTLKENTEREELIKAKEKEQWAKKEAKERELYYDEIRQKDIILQNLIQNIPGGIGLFKIYDQNINIIYFSEGTPRLSGLTHDEYVEWIEDDLLKRSVHPDDLPLLLSEIKRAIPIGAPIIVTYRIYHKGGYYVWIMLHAIKIREEDGYPIYYAIFTSLPEEIIQYKILCERTPTALYVIEKGTHKILYENAQAKDLAKQINSQNETICYKKLYDRDEPCDFCPTSTLKGDSVFEKDVTIEKLGKHFIVKSQSINWYGKEAIASYITDETSILEEKKHAELLRQAQMANEAKTNFLARVSHDMRTPLHAILGLTYLSKDKNDTDKLKEDIIEIENAARLLLNLVNDTLDMGKIESNKLELHPTLCDEREVFNTIFNVMRSRLESKNIKFTSKEIGIDYKTMYFDVPRLQQIFINLLS